MKRRKPTKMLLPVPMLSHTFFAGIAVTAALPVTTIVSIPPEAAMHAPWKAATRTAEGREQWKAWGIKNQHNLKLFIDRIGFI